MSMSESEYKAIADFFKEWSLAMLADFYKYERKAIHDNYISMEEEYLKGSTEEYQIVKFLIANKELWEPISVMLSGIKLEQTLSCDEEQYLITYISHLPKHYKVILVAFSRGFLLEWLYFNMGIGDYTLVLSEGEMIDDDNEYCTWKRKFGRLENCRAELVLKYAKYSSFYFYYRVLGLRVWDYIFDWIHSKCIKDCFIEEIVEMSGDCMVYLWEKYMKRCKEKDWYPILKIPKLPLPEKVDTFSAQYYLHKAIKNGLMERSGAKYKWKGKTKVLLVYFLARIYCDDRVLNGCWTKGVDTNTYKDMRFSNTGILEVIFETSGIGVTRRKNIDKPAPEGYEKVDKLFKE